VIPLTWKHVEAQPDQEERQDSSEDWPQSPTYSRWSDSPHIARAYGQGE
jgi:hypothetical protein